MSNLPDLFHPWVKELLHGETPEETVATCHNCAMVDAKAESQGTISFRKEVKCCTYLPSLPNFLVGRILNDTDVAAIEGKKSVLARIAKGIAVTPLAVDPDPRTFAIYKDSPDAFGRNNFLRCPHLSQDGACGIWKNRNSVCATWFCKHQRGATGHSFWDALRKLLQAIEYSLSVWCLLELNFNRQCLSSIFTKAYAKGNVLSNQRYLSAYELDQRPDPVEQKVLWGEWLGREAEFYQQCARLVDQLDWKAVVDICGPEVGGWIKIVKEKYEELKSTVLPERLSVGHFKLVQITLDFAKVETYSRLDPLKMSRRLYNVLPFFEGREIEEARGQIRAEKGFDVGLSFVAKLVDHHILVPQNAPHQPAGGNGGPADVSRELANGEPLSSEAT